MGDRIMDVIALIAFIGCIYLSGFMARRRGRSFQNWAVIAAFIGPLAFPLIFLFPNLHGKDPQGPYGEKGPADFTDAVKPVVPGNSDPDHLNKSFASGSA
jgi:hypothetical protein